MDNRWFLISKISMSEGAYAALLVSNIMRIPGMEYSDDQLIIHALNTVMPNQQEIYETTFLSFFANDIAKARLDGRTNKYHIHYNLKSQQLEFIYAIENVEFSEIVRLTNAFMSVVSFKNIETSDFFVAAEGTRDNISFIAGIGVKTSRFSVPEPIFSLPRDLTDLWNSVFDPHRPQFIQEGLLFDKDIADEYERIIKTLLAQGRDTIIKNATPEAPLMITNDLLYKTDGKNVIGAGGEVVVGAHPESFISLKHNYAKDDWEIYYGTQHLKAADVDSFEVLAWGYAKDKYSAYYCGKKIARIATRFKALRPAYGYATDNAVVYYCGKAIENSDPSSFYAAGEGALNGGIYLGVDKHHVYLDGEKLLYIDAASFAHIGKTFFKDKQHVYYRENIINGCRTEKVKVLNTYYIADTASLFFCSEEGIVKAERKGITNIRTQGVIAADEERVYYKGVPIPDADGKTAKIRDSFNDGYILDTKHVFYFNEKLAASSATFQPIGFGYAHDGQSVFFGDKRIAGADAASFQAVSYGNAFDKKAKYCFGKKVIKRASPNIVNIGGQYYKDSSYIYYVDSILDAAAHESFETLTTCGNESYDYAKDAIHVYFKGKAIKGAEPESFALLPIHPLDTDATPQIYAVDAKNVYFEGVKIHGANPSTFKAFEAHGAWTDSYKMFIDGKELRYIDMPTLVSLDSGFCCDTNSVYFGVTLLDNLLPDSVMVLDDHYIRDDMYIYYAEKLPDGTIVANTFPVDYNTFDILEDNKAFAFDKNHIFFRGKPIDGLDFNKIELIGDDYITDGDSLFCGDTKFEGADIATFVLLGEGYATDKTQAYYKSTPLKTNAPPHILGSGYATDGKTFWRYGQVIEKPSENIFLQRTLGELFTYGM